ncbi:unnamed protein product [Callosobruchus maculatus]|uniref:Uncharacterized protein n=1 Tax=Callosobruchus maculatus TaxID=64391 RepID=A0A653C972_CALMS|nr:unnamed protein product [Callosobruchus maculatus]
MRMHFLFTYFVVFEICVMQFCHPCRAIFLN